MLHDTHHDTSLSDDYGEEKTTTTSLECEEIQFHQTFLSSNFEFHSHFLSKKSQEKMTKENSLLFHRQGCFTFRYASIHSYALMDQIMDLLVTAQRRRVVVKIYQPHFLPFFSIVLKQPIKRLIFLGE